VTSWAAEQVVWFCKPDGSQLMQRDILKHSLHSILKTKKNKKTKKQLGLEQGGFNIFRRFRMTELETAEVPGDSGPCRSVFRDMPIAGSGVIAIMIPG
jgi:hypothetical protein